MATKSNVDLPKIASSATKLSNDAEEMFKVLKQASTTLENTKNVYDSKEGRTMRQRFEEYSAKFQTFKNDVDNFGVYAKDYANKFGSVQDELDQIGNQLPIMD